MTELLSNIPNFYPTPPQISAKMFSKVNILDKKYILEPSAGKGDLANFVKKYYSVMYDNYSLKMWMRDNNTDRRDTKTWAKACEIVCTEEVRCYNHNGPEIECVEIDKNLYHILRDEGYIVSMEDFLQFYSEKKYDLIVMNPPFDHGDEHLLKALSLQERFGGEIVCLLNAETIRNPYSNTRKELLKRLSKYDTEYEYIKNGFVEAERSTSVEVVIVHTTIPPRQVGTSLILEDLKRAEPITIDTPPEFNAIITADYIQAAVIQYRAEIAAGRKLIEEYEAIRPILSTKLSVPENADNYTKEHANMPIIRLVCGDNSSDYSYHSIDVNDYIKKVRYKYWYELLHKPVFLGNLTSNLRSEYFSKISELAECEFSLPNIYQVKIDILNDMVRGVEDKILELFEKFTYKHSCEAEGNIHYFNGWKTNKAFIINKKVVVPYMNTWDDIFKRFRYEYDFNSFLSDIEKTLEFLDANKTENHTRDIHRWLQYYEDIQQTKNMNFNYFDVTVYKKGTAHITFTNEELLKKLNIYGCQKKGWLPPCYGKKSYSEMNDEEKSVIDEFEGEESYTEVYNNRDKYLVETNSLLALPEESSEQ